MAIKGEKITAVRTKYAELRSGKSYPHNKAIYIVADMYGLSMKTIEQYVRDLRVKYNGTVGKVKKPIVRLKPPELVLNLIGNEVLAYRKILPHLSGEEETKYSEDLAVLEKWLKEVGG